MEAESTSELCPVSQDLRFALCPEESGNGLEMSSRNSGATAMEARRFDSGAKALYITANYI
jgi:hypothetical protein